jgi:hypothetical protein
VSFYIGQVHRTALALAHAGLLAQHLGHEPFYFCAYGYSVTVITVSGNDMIAILSGTESTDNHCFLTNIKMEEATDLSLLVQFRTPLFKSPDKDHQAIPFQ